VDINGPAVAELMAYVAAAVSRRVAAVSDDVYEVILGEIPELRADKPVLALLASSVHSNVSTCLQIMQHQIDLSAMHEHHARLRDTLLVFLQTGGSYKAAAERLMLHKNTIQYRVRKAGEGLGRPLGENQHDVELALRASHWLGSAVLQPAREGSAAPTGSV
jgi:DNA-binding PucR family transcriptional regulator